MNTFRTLFMISLWVAVSWVFADEHIVYETVTEAHEIMGQKRPEQKTETHIWFNSEKAVTENPAQKSIVDLKKGVVYFILHPQKSYLEMKIPIDFAAYLPEPVRAVMGQMKTTVTVTPLEETRKILGSECKAYDVLFESGVTKVTSRIFVSENTQIDYGVYKKQFEDTFTRLKMQMLDEEGLKALNQIKGFYMAFDMTMNIMGSDMVTKTTAVSMDKADPPAGTYEIPEGYTKLDVLPMPQGSQ